MTANQDFSIENLNDLIEIHTPFIIRTVSNFTGRYVSIENDDEFSIALEGFAEAVERYDPERGSFLSFVRLVIESRLKNYNSRACQYPETVSIDELYESGVDFEDTSMNPNRHDNDLVDEIDVFVSELKFFSLNLEILADSAPKHRDSRERSLSVAEIASGDEPTVKLTYDKKKLPIRHVARLANVTEKLVKGNKHFILGAMIVFVKKLKLIIDWIKESRC